ncbi:ATP-binding protein [Nocardia cyriacigeorgica]|uniref:ATP-binding protein n=1 Tax=Nocardia cyriacigeorgica TaxID=135487 RepID=A0A5R8P8D7_9NOCA|nr:ATP-binding protein [Nocardia cyriacigeorgica]TLG01754.1 ATP-binding protein [Nocardia cyriacigeorgica]
MPTSALHPVITAVSGPPGSGKSTLAHALATRLGILAIIRDEIKQGMVAATTPTRDGDYDDLDIPVLNVFFEMLTVLARGGVSVIAEAAFQDKLWRPNLLKLAEFAEIRIIHCTTPQQVLHDRITHRAEHDPHRRAHNDAGLLAEIAAGTRTAASFIPVSMDVAQMTVDTTEGYEPGLDALAQFVTVPGNARSVS